MPLFIDRHELCDLVTAEAAAQRHLNDIKVQHLYNCRKLSYWFDEKRRTSFCLFEAPDKASLEEMHKHAHDNIPNQITEVDAGILNSFLKQIKGLNKLEKLELPVTLPTFLVSRTSTNEVNYSDTKPIKRQHRDSRELILEAIHHFDGNIISQSNEYFLVAFQSGQPAISCALKMHKAFQKKKGANHQVKIGISGGIPAVKEESTIKSSIKLAKRLCNISKSKILVTLEVSNLLQSKSTKVIIKGDRIKSVAPDDIRFITLLLDYMEENWKDHNLHANDFENQLGFSKSQIYRKMISLIGESPNAFIKEYRLNRAYELLRNKSGNISEIAFDSGFSSPSYFSKCFYKKYGIKPSEFLQLTK